jgi:large subunit ribosomal protein L32
MVSMGRMAPICREHLTFCDTFGALRLDWRPLMAVPKRKTSKARRDQRRATHKLEAPRVNTCPQCGSPKRAHRICPTCGTYKGREVEPLRFDAP